MRCEGNQLESLILAQNERWRRALHMQVERESDFGREYSGERVSNTWTTCLGAGNNLGKPGLIPHTLFGLRVDLERWPLLESHHSQGGPRLISLLVG